MTFEEVTRFIEERRPVVIARYGVRSRISQGNVGVPVKTIRKLKGDRVRTYVDVQTKSGVTRRALLCHLRDPQKGHLL